MSLVLRIRRETLRESLRRAYETLMNLSSGHERLDKLKQQLRTASEEMKRHRDTIENVANDRLLIDENFLSKMQEGMNKLYMEFSLPTELKLIEKQSFIAKVKNSAVIEWQNRIRGRALQQLNRIVDETTWSELNRIEDASNETVFAASVELLGGIALRDVRLNAEVCELAEELLKTIRSAPAHRWAMLGGLASILMRLDDVVRLPFPQWSVWHLPFAVHELWRVEVQLFADIKGRLPQDKLNKPDIDQCLADACTTYVLGPAFAYAALTLSFDPADSRFDSRVEAICAMLVHMTGQERGGVSYEQTVAAMIEAEWKIAKDAARRAAAAPSPEPQERFLKQLRDALSQELGAQEPRNAFDAAWDRAVATLTVAQPVALAQEDDFQPLCKPLAEALQDFGFLSFSQSMWKAVRKDLKAVLDPKGNERDLRKVLNAAWDARIRPDVTAPDLPELASERAGISGEKGAVSSNLSDDEKKVRLLADLVRAHVRGPLDSVAARPAISASRQPVGELPP